MCSLVTDQEKRLAGDQGVVIFGHPRHDVLGFQVACKLCSQLRLFEKEFRILGREDLQATGHFAIVIEAHRNIDNKFVAPNGLAFPPFFATMGGESLKAMRKRHAGKFAPFMDSLTALQVRHPASVHSLL